MIWTLVLVSSGVTGLYLAPRHWWGWAVNAGTEALWFVYALSIHATALAVMATVWFAVNARNAVHTRKATR